MGSHCGGPAFSPRMCPRQVIRFLSAPVRTGKRPVLQAEAQSSGTRTILDESDFGFRPSPGLRPFPQAGPGGRGSPPSPALSRRYEILPRMSFDLFICQPAPQVPVGVRPSPERSRRRYRHGARPGDLPRRLPRHAAHSLRAKAGSPHPCFRSMYEHTLSSDVRTLGVN